jgi:hypothetical protein
MFAYNPQGGWRAVDADMALAADEVAFEDTPSSADLELAFPGLPARRLDEARRDACATIDTAAETARLRYLTPGSGQAAVYLAKDDEARRVADDPAASADRYPLLAASIGIERGLDGAPAQTVADVAAIVLASATAWRQAAAQIERVRLGAKAAIGEAADVTAIGAVLAGLTWPGRAPLE